MMSKSTELFAKAARPVVRQRLSELSNLSYEEVAKLPEVSATDVVIAGMKASLSVFRQDNVYQLEGKTLVVILAARPTMFGMCQQHIEQGLVFSQKEPAREATELELQNSGG